MIAVIELPYKDYAGLKEEGWICDDDPTVIPVLNYFTKRLPAEVRRKNLVEIAIAVAAMITGARLYSVWDQGRRLWLYDEPPIDFSSL